jgi:hypothetical protein
MIRTSLLAAAAFASLAMFSAAAEAQCTMGNWGPYTEETIGGDHDQSCFSSTGFYSAHVVVDQMGFGGFRRATLTRSNQCALPLETAVKITLDYQQMNINNGAILQAPQSSRFSASCSTAQGIVRTETGSPLWIHRARCIVGFGSGC